MTMSPRAQITPEGNVTRVAQAIPSLGALHTAPDGRFLAAEGREVYELSLDDYSLAQLGRIPAPQSISPNGLTTDGQGNIYLSTGARRPGGQVYRLDADGQYALLADIPLNGLSGIEWRPETGEIVGGSARRAMRSSI